MASRIAESRKWRMRPRQQQHDDGETATRILMVIFPFSHPQWSHEPPFRSFVGFSNPAIAKRRVWTAKFNDSPSPTLLAMHLKAYLRFASRAMRSARLLAARISRLPDLDNKNTPRRREGIRRAAA